MPVRLVNGTSPREMAGCFARQRVSGVTCRVCRLVQVVFVVFEALNSSLGLSMEVLFLGYAVICVVLFSTSAVLWFMNPKYNKSAKTTEEDERQALLAVTAATDAGPSYGGGGNLNTSLSMGLNVSINGGVVEGAADEDAVEQVLLRGKRMAEKERERDKARTGPESSLANAVVQVDRYVRVADRPLKEQIKSPEFIFIYVFSIVHMVGAHGRSFVSCPSLAWTPSRVVEVRR